MLLGFFLFKLLNSNVTYPNLICIVTRRGSKRLSCVGGSGSSSDTSTEDEKIVKNKQNEQKNGEKPTVEPATLPPDQKECIAVRDAENKEAKDIPPLDISDATEIIHVSYLKEKV